MLQDANCSSSTALLGCGAAPHTIGEWEERQTPFGESCPKLIWVYVHTPDDVPSYFDDSPYRNGAPNF